MTDRVVIVGGGHAAGQCAVSLRQKGWRGEIVIVGEEKFLPYQRPPLSKAYLSGELDAERLYVRPAAVYEKEDINLRLGVRAQKIDRVQKTLALSDGSALGYSYLVLATGARIRKLSLPGAALNGVGYVRNIDDVDGLKDRMKPGANLVVIGAGYIGLEVAAVARKAGLTVKVLEMADRVMSRVTSPIVSEFFEGLHKSHGVDIRLGASVAAIEGDENVSGVRLGDGELLPADFVVAGIGIIANTDIAGEAGLTVDDGIVVDECTQTDDPAIFAIGDCTRHPSVYFGGLLRLESVHNALEQAKTAAMAIVGQRVIYDQPPWFWSDQYDIKLQTVGISNGREGPRYDSHILRGSPDGRAFSVFYLKDEHIVAVDSVNAPADHMASRRLIAANVRVDPGALSDPDFVLMSLLKKA